VAFPVWKRRGPGAESTRTIVKGTNSKWGVRGINKFGCQVSGVRGSEVGAANESPVKARRSIVPERKGVK